MNSNVTMFDGIGFISWMVYKVNIVDGLLVGFPYYWDDKWDNNDGWYNNDPRQFRSQTSDSMGRWKRGREEKEPEEKESEESRSTSANMTVEKSGNTTACPVFCGSRGSTSRLTKAAGAEPSGEMRDEQLHAIVARSTWRSQNTKTRHCRSTVGS